MNTKLNTILAEISAGELIDKITILEIKKNKISNKNKLVEIEKELISLNDTFRRCIPTNTDILHFKTQLRNINQQLWEIEDGKRLAEKNNKFDDHFIKLARNVYKLNDKRAEIKLAINNALGSNIKEVKSYE